VLVGAVLLVGVLPALTSREQITALRGG